jgi:hypothetical protein
VGSAAREKSSDIEVDMFVDATAPRALVGWQSRRPTSSARENAQHRAMKIIFRFYSIINDEDFLSLCAVDIVGDSTTLSGLWMSHPSWCIYKHFQESLARVQDAMHSCNNKEAAHCAED